MKFCHWAKDGGPESKVWGFWLVEIKSWFSIALLRFDPGSRDAYHSHAFNSVSYVVCGSLVEEHLNEVDIHIHISGDRIVTRRETFHKVTSFGTSWVLTLRGPWAETWQEAVPGVRTRTLTHGRRECQQ